MNPKKTAIKEEHVVAQTPLTEDLFYEFIRTKFPYSIWPTGWNINDETDARLAASWLLGCLQELNKFLLEKQERAKNLDETRVPKSKSMDRKKQIELQRELNT